MSNRPRMEPGDWINAALILAVGLFLGLALSNMIRLASTPSWPLVILIPALFGAVLLFDRMIGGLFEKIFPSGLRSASISKGKKRKPLALLGSLPMGIIIGLIGAEFGLDDLLL